MKSFFVRAWPAVGALTIVVMVMSIIQSLQRYEEFRSGFSWDLAYYNQWFWAITRGAGVLSVRPGADYAFEGPSVWMMNYLSPIRFAALPIYALFPDPRTLLIFHGVVFWCVIPAAYTLARSESQSKSLALAIAALVPLTPIVWPLAWNDFRELQLAVPFVLWAIQGWRARSRGVAALGIAGVLACRQEFALLVMSLVLLPPQQPETRTQRQHWIAAAALISVTWFSIFLAYLTWRADLHAVADYFTQFMSTKSSFAATTRSATAFLVVGLSSWSLAALLAPRVAVLAVPWIWVLSSGRWEPQLISTPHWHHVRYAAPLTALVLSAGVVGLATAGSFVSPAVRAKATTMMVIVAAAGLAVQSVVLQTRFAAVPIPIAASEAQRLWSMIDEVDPADGVLTSYDVSAPLSSRRWLFSYEVEENWPAGFPRLAPGIRWAFIRSDHFPASLFLDQGFTQVSAGPYIRVFRRFTPLSDLDPPRD